jgi:hypothetical protein
MRKLIYTALASASLATASMASAAVIVNSGTPGLNNPFPTAVNNANGSVSINFGANPATSPTFSESFNFTNTVAGLYTILISTTDSSLQFTSGSLTGTGGVNFALTPGTNPITGTSELGRAATQLAAGTYTLAFSGNNPIVGGSFTGNAFISPAAVPEPATWAMMLLGFGGMGFVIRRKRQPLLAQIA